jgi:hypothetical protein
MIYLERYRKPCTKSSAGRTKELPSYRNSYRQKTGRLGSYMFSFSAPKLLYQHRKRIASPGGTGYGNGKGEAVAVQSPMGFNHLMKKKFAVGDYMT